MIGLIWKQNSLKHLFLKIKYSYITFFFKTWDVTILLFWDVMHVYDKIQELCTQLKNKKKIITPMHKQYCPKDWRKTEINNFLKLHLMKRKKKVGL